MQKLLAVGAFGILAAACGSGSPTAGSPVPEPTPTSAKAAVVTVSVSPNPVTIAPNTDSHANCGNGTCLWEVTYSVTVSETAGVACNINTLEYSSPYGVFGALNPSQITNQVGTNFVAGHGHLVIPFALQWDPSVTTTQYQPVSVQVIDAFGNFVTAAALVQFLPAVQAGSSNSPRF